MVDLQRPGVLTVFQVPDAATYPQTMALLQMVDPVEIVFPRTAESSVLFRKTQQFWAEERGVALRTIHRKHFNDSLGHRQLQRLAARPVAPDVLASHLILAAAAALLGYVEHVQSTTFEAESLQVVFASTRGRMALDFATLRNLEIFVGGTSNLVEDSLLAFLDRTKTLAGQRVLRAQLLAPPNNPAVIASRQDVVEGFLRSPDWARSLAAALGPLPDLDFLVGHFVHKPRVTTPRTAQATIRAFVQLKQLLQQLPGLKDVVEGGPPGGLVTAASELLRDEGFALLATEIGRVLNDDVEWSSSAVQLRQQLCFAVRGGLDGNLDVLRRIYSATVDEIGQVLTRYRERWDMSDLALRFNVSRGYYLAVSAERARRPLPPELIQRMQPRRGAPVLCSTDELVALNARVDETFTNVLLITSDLLTSLRASVRRRINLLFKLTDAVGLLDMLHAFAAVATRASTARTPWVRPRLSARDHPEDECIPLRILQGRGPLLEHRQRRACVPNDFEVFATDLAEDEGVSESNSQAPDRSEAASAAAGDFEDSASLFAVSTGSDDFVPARRAAASSVAPSEPQSIPFDSAVLLPSVPSSSSSSSSSSAALGGAPVRPQPTLKVLVGPNSSGKSTFLRMVAHVVLLAHLGSFVPAERADLAPLTRLCTRLGAAADDEEAGVSSFLAEMRELASALDAAHSPSERALVLVDELGRGTCTEDGVSIAWAAAEELVARRVPAVFVTHFHELEHLPTLFPGRAAVLSTSVVTDPLNHQLRFFFRVEPAVERVERDYGIQLARESGLPAELVALAGRLRSVLSDSLRDSCAGTGATTVLHGALSELRPLLPLASASDETGRDAWRRLLVSVARRHAGFLRRWSRRLPPIPAPATRAASARPSDEDAVVQEEPASASSPATPLPDPPSTPIEPAPPSLPGAPASTEEARSRPSWQDVFGLARRSELRTPPRPSPASADDPSKRRRLGRD